jgi:alkylation response protein AidB-like acyl-CoA dehydrogenase
MTRLFSEHFLLTLETGERTWVDRVREITRTVLGPNAAQVGREDVFAWENFRLLAREGVLGTAFPTAYGGSEARQRLRIRLIEEVGRVCSTSASLITGADLSARAIVAGASEEIKRDLIPQLCRGEVQAAFALTEPGAGSDVRALRTTARDAGDHYVLDGRKKYITRAGVADWLVVVARCITEWPSPPADAHAKPQADTPAPLVALLVRRDAPGVHIGPDVDKLGWFGVPIAEPRFDAVRVDKRWQLGAVGEGFTLAQDALVRARLGHAAMALGRAIGAVEIAAAYCTERETFGRPLGAHQGVQWMLADSVTQIEASRALLDAAADAYDRGSADAAVRASMAKLHATDLCMEVVTDALQLCGGRGYLRDFPLERFFRDAKLNQIGEGASEVHKTVIGRDVVRRAATAERNPCLPSGSLTTDV